MLWVFATLYQTKFEEGEDHGEDSYNGLLSKKARNIAREFSGWSRGTMCPASCTYTHYKYTDKDTDKDTDTDIDTDIV